MLDLEEKLEMGQKEQGLEHEKKKEQEEEFLTVHCTLDSSHQGPDC